MGRTTLVATGANDRRRGRALGPRARTTILSGLLVTGSVLGMWVVGRIPHAQAPGLRISWLLLAVAFAATEKFVCHFEIRGEVQSFSFSELPIVLGLFFASPSELVLARLVGATASLVLLRRQPPLKLFFNMSVFAAECAVALLVFRLVVEAPSYASPAAWVAAFAGVAVADGLSVGAVVLVIGWHGGHPRAGLAIAASTFAAVANSSLAVIAAIIIPENPWTLVVLGAFAGLLLVAYRGYAGLQQRYASLQILYDFTEAIGGSQKPADVMAAMLDNARRLLRADVAEITLLAEDQRVLLSLRGEDPLEERDALLPDAFVQSHVIEQGRSVLAPRGAKSREIRDFLDRSGTKDCIVTSLQRDGESAAIFTVANRLADVSTFDAEDVRLFETLANHASIALQNGRLISQLRNEAARRRHQALHDALTRLPNRTNFYEQCERALASPPSASGRIAIMLMDLNHFKDVNDTLGHQTGDRLLVEMGNRLSATVGPRAVAARLGGDEFAVLLPFVDDLAEPMAVAHDILEAVRRPVSLEGLELEVGASIGIAMWPDHGLDATSLLQRADVAMYAAKVSRGGVRVYARDEDHYSPRRLALAAELRHAIDACELEVHYQPKAAIADGRIVGVEALVRWYHPQHGALSPDEFIPLAEQTGLVKGLTDFVLATAVDQIRVWRDLGLDLHVAVNLAAPSLVDPTLASRVHAVLLAAGVPPEALVLEITESSVMADEVRSLAVLTELADLGVTLSVDDFGTGYSSLSYLQRLPVQEVKIDRSFVFNVGTDGNDAAIVRSIVELSRTLNLRVVAEGVEDRLAWDRLASLGCDLAQGYFLSRPVPAVMLTDWLCQRAAAVVATVA